MGTGPILHLTFVITVAIAAVLAFLHNNIIKYEVSRISPVTSK